MFIKTIEPILEQPSPDYQKGRLLFRLSVRVHCPSCKSDYVMKTKGSLLTFPLAGGLLATIEREIENLFAPAFCEKCGVYQIVAPPTQNRWRAEIIKVATAEEWIVPVFERLTGKKVNDPFFGTWTEKKVLGEGSQPRSS